jgi:molybdate transport system substrate-binding protein
MELTKRSTRKGVDMKTPTTTDAPDRDSVTREAPADLRVLALNGMKLLMPDIALGFRRSMGRGLSVRTEGSALLLEDITRGEPFDVVLLMAPNMDTAVSLAKVLPASRLNIARTSLGVVVREGQAKPDMGSVEAFARTMLDARSVAYTTRGTSGVHFMAVCKRLGIAEQVIAKGKTMPTGMVARLVASGEAELAVQQMSELAGLEGVDLVGPFPPELNLTSQIVAAVGAGSERIEAAATFIAFLSSPEVVALLRSRLMTLG